MVSISSCCADRKNAWQFNYSVIFVQHNELFMNRSDGELYNIVTTINCFRNVRDLVKFD